MSVAMWREASVLRIARVAWVGWLLAAGAPALADERAEFADLEAALNTAIEELNADYEGRLALVREVYVYAENKALPDDSLVLKARYVEAMANMRLGNFTESRQQVDALCRVIPMDDAPELRFRCDTLRAYLMLVRGEREESLAAYRAIFAASRGKVSQRLLTRGRIGYAVVLNENGKSAEAVDMYEVVLVNAINNEDDLISLYAGNNLIVILIDLGDYKAAEQTLNQLAPVVERNPDSIVAGSLRLHELELARLNGRADAAVVGLQSFIDNQIDNTPLMLGSAHKILADALMETGELDQAVEQAREAIRLLVDQAYEVSEARMSLAEALMLQGNFEDAITELEVIDPAAEVVPSTLVRFKRLMLRARLNAIGDTESLQAFDDYAAAESARDVGVTTTRAEYFEARQTAAKQALALEQAEELARSETELRNRDQRINRLMLAFIVTASLLGVLLLASQFRRNAEKRVLEEKSRMHDKLERKRRIEAIGMLASNVAHDFNNLLQVVASSNETIKRHAGDSSKDVETAILLSEQALDHGANILRQLLTFSRKQGLEASPIPFSNYLETTKALLTFAVGEENSLRIDDRSGGVAILVDPTLFTSSILNVLSNCVDAMPNGGEVRIAAEEIHVDEFNIKYSKEVKRGRYLKLQIRDTGAGMDQQTLDQAVEPFFTTKDLHSGSGLGLSSVYGFVQQSGGDLWLSSQPGEGTSVELIFPIVDAPAAVAKEIVKPAKRANGKVRVLMVEDNEMLSSALAKNLNTLGYEVEREANADDAKASLLATGVEFDVLLTDIRMPGSMNGLDLAKWARPQFEEMKIILMSGYVDWELDTSEFDVLHKPFTKSDLVGVLK